MPQHLLEKKLFLPNVKINQVLARDVLSPNGKLILPKGTILTQSHIVRMRQYGVSELWLEEQQPEVRALGILDASITRAYKDAVTTVDHLFEAAKRELKIDTHQTRRALEDLLSACKSETNFLNLVMNLRTFDVYTYQHSIGVGLLSRQIAEWMGLPDDQCQEVFLAATLHDIGKGRIDEEILNKPGRLNPEEYEHVKQHAQFGYQILINSGLPTQLAMPAYNHHERMNGCGYPRQLKGPDIDLYSRIVSVADVFNAMTSRRVYHDPVSYYRVLDELQQNAFGELDPAIVRLFLNKMTTFLVGNTVTLNDGTLGKVIHIPTEHPTRPLIQTQDGFISLIQATHLYVESIVAI